MGAVIQRLRDLRKKFHAQHHLTKEETDEFDELLNQALDYVEDVNFGGKDENNRSGI